MTAQPLELTLKNELPAARNGSQQAYGRIVSACQNTVTAIALAITRDLQASEDIAQEAFLRAWQQLDRLKNNTSFLPWLRQITRNLARDHLRGNQHRPLTGERADIAIQLTADPLPTPSERLLRTEEEIIASDIISTLPEDSRETLLLFYREGQSSQQVADLLGLSDAAVRKRLSRARALVRDELMQRFGDFARASAPGSAFTLMVVGALSLASPTASAAALIGSGLLGGGAAAKLAGTGISGGVAGGSVGVTLQSFGQAPAHLGTSLGAMAGGVAGGALGLVFTHWYLLRFARSREQRASIHRFMWTYTPMAALAGLMMVASALLSSGWGPMSISFVIGMGLLNYHFLFVLPSIMAPMLADPANRKWARSYDYVLGRKAVMLSVLVTLAAMVYALTASGRLQAGFL